MCPRSPQRPPLHIPAVGRKDEDSGRDLEQQRDEYVTGGIKGVACSVKRRGDSAAHKRSRETKQYREPKRERVRAGQRKPCKAADQ